jgi:predicted acetyltransferase
MAVLVEVRELTAEQLGEAWQLGRLAFGLTPADPPASALKSSKGVTRYGAFDRAGRLIGKANDLHHEQWWDGRAVSVADVGGVAVIPEFRNHGVSRALLRRLLEDAHRRGAAFSALFPTVTAVYRSAGWALAGALYGVDIPVAALPVGRDHGLTVRPGTPADLGGSAGLYAELARCRNGLLTRVGAAWDPPADRFPDGVDGLTVVQDRGRLVGYACWSRGPGFGQDAVLEVRDALAATTDAARALIAVLASWRSVVATVRFHALLSGALATELPLEAATTHRVRRWMHRPVDVGAAVAARRWPPWVQAQAIFSLRDELAPWNTGTWRLEIADGLANLEPTIRSTAPRLTVEGFAQLFTGAASPAILRETGLADFAPGDDPRKLQPLMGNPRAELLDYF